MRPDGRREAGDGRPSSRPAGRPAATGRGRHGVLLTLLALATVSLLAGARDFTDEVKRRHRIRVHLDRELAALTARPDADRRRRLHEEILNQPLLARSRLSAGMWAAGLIAGSWTPGTRRAAVIVDNASDSPRAVALQLQSAAPPPARPQRVFVDDGLATREILFEAPATRYLEMPRLPAVSRRLLAVWTDQAFSPDGGGSPERGIRVRAGDPALQRLLELRATRQAKRWREVAEELAADAYFERFDLDDPRLVAFGVTGDGWSRGTAPGAVLAVNDGARPFTPRLKLRGPERADVYPLTVSIDGGSRVRRLTFAAPGSRTVRLRRVRPGHQRVFLVWTDKSWSADFGERQLGIRLRARPASEARRERSEP